MSKSIELLKSRAEPPSTDEWDGASDLVICPDEERTGGHIVQAPMWSRLEKLVVADRGRFTHSGVPPGNPWFDPVAGGNS